jgi:hypothetical protein
MKVITLFFTAFFVNFSSVNSAKEYTLEEALQKGVIQAEYFGNDKSTHYGKPIRIKLQNRANEKVVIRIISGYRFMSVDNDVQDILTTQEEIFAINPYETITETVAGMCVQHHNGAPNSDDKYTFSGLEKGPLLAFSQTIDSTNNQSVSAQQAMWVLSDDEDIYDLVNYGGDEEWILAKRVAHLSGKELPSRENFNREVAKRTQRKAELRGVFKFRFSRPVPIHIALFDENGIVLKEIFRKTASAGQHKVEYTFDALPHQGKTIYAKLIAHEDVLMSRKIEL